LPLELSKGTNGANQRSRAVRLSEPVVRWATCVPLFIGLLKMEEGRRARPRSDVPLRDAVTPHMGSRDVVTRVTRS
jgi:hypothetical protein